MAKEVSINLFDLEWDQHTQRLRDTLDEYRAMLLTDRWRYDIRLEEIVPHTDRHRDVYLLDFAKRREVGPGRLGRRVPIAPIELNRDEDFGEETAALYAPGKRWLLVLHNHAGVGASRMCSYFNAVDPNNEGRPFTYAARPKLDGSAARRFEGMERISRVSVTATADALAEAQADTGAAFAHATRSVNARRVKFELVANDKYQRGGFLALGQTLGLIKGLQEQDEDQVSHLEVKGEVDGRDQIIDLIEHKIRKKFPASDLQVVHHRYTLESRWNLLLRAYHYWHDNL